jgi:hypothetical protein
VRMAHHFLTIQMEPQDFIKPSVQTYTVHMELSLYLRFQPRCSLGGYTMGTIVGILSHDHGGLSPMVTPPNPAAVPVVSYENLLCLPSSEQL